MYLSTADSRVFSVGDHRKLNSEAEGYWCFDCHQSISGAFLSPFKFMNFPWSRFLESLFLQDFPIFRAYRFPRMLTLNTSSLRKLAPIYPYIHGWPVFRNSEEKVLDLVSVRVALQTLNWVWNCSRWQTGKWFYEFSNTWLCLISTP